MTVTHAGYRGAGAPGQLIAGSAGARPDHRISGLEQTSSAVEKAVMS